MSANQFSTVGFSGSRSLIGRQAVLCSQLAQAAINKGQQVFVGCAGGADAAARRGVTFANGRATVFTAKSGRSYHLVARSVQFVKILANAPAPVLVSFPNSTCHPLLLPSASQSKTFSGYGSGSWATLALAVGLGLPVRVYLPPPVQPPAHWGTWSIVSAGPFYQFWHLAPAQKSLF